MNDPDYDVHPLDRDYSEPEPKPKRMPGLPDGQLHRAGLIIFTIGFVSLLITAAVLGIFRGSGVIETAGSYVHRFSMVMILAGGILILVGLRVKTWNLDGTKQAAKKMAAFRGMGLLLIINIAAFPAVQSVMQFFRFTFSMEAGAMAYNGALTVITALLVTAAVMHGGVIRGYAIGFTVAMVMGHMGGMAFFNFYNTRSVSWLVAQQLFIVQLSGMICAFYVALVERGSPDKRDAI